MARLTRADLPDMFDWLDFGDMRIDNNNRCSGRKRGYALRRRSERTHPAVQGRSLVSSAHALEWQSLWSEPATRISAYTSAGMAMPRVMAVEVIHRFFCLSGEAKAFP